MACGRDPDSMARGPGRKIREMSTFCDARDHAPPFHVHTKFFRRGQSRRSHTPQKRRTRGPTRARGSGDAGQSRNSRSHIRAHLVSRPRVERSRLQNNRGLVCRTRPAERSRLTNRSTTRPRGQHVITVQTSCTTEGILHCHTTCVEGCVDGTQCPGKSTGDHFLFASFVRFPKGGKGFFRY